MLTSARDITQVACDSIYARIVDAFDQAEQTQDGLHFLARLALLLSIEVGDESVVERLVQVASASDANGVTK